MIQYNTFQSDRLEAVKALYHDANWTAYLKDDIRLQRAFDQSLYILGAFENDTLLGFVRCVGDGEHIVVVQDLIVHSAQRGKGIGTYLFRAALEQFSHVRMVQVVTDVDDASANRFYVSCKMQPIADVRLIAYCR